MSATRIETVEELAAHLSSRNFGNAATRMGGPHDYWRAEASAILILLHDPSAPVDTPAAGLRVTREQIAAVVNTCRDNDHIVSSLALWLGSLPGVTVADEVSDRG